MRPFIIWTLTFLLSFEPALFAAGKGANGNVKAFLEYSQLAQKPVTIQEFFTKNSNLLPEEVNQDFQTFLKKNGQLKMPKFDVSKILVNGEEQYQLQAIENGKSASVTVVLGKEVFAKVNGKNLTWADMNDPRQVFAKLDVNSKVVAENFPGSKPTKNTGLTAEQLSKLTPDQRKQYIKQLRGLMESMEAVENAFAGKKTTSNELLKEKLQVVAMLLSGEFAQAASVDPKDLGRGCVAAGWMTAVGMDGSRQACGAGDKNAHEGCGAELRCNPTIFGTNNGSPICLPAGRDTTKGCGAAVKDSDIPDTLNDLAKIVEFRDKAIKYADDNISHLCGNETKVKGSKLVEDQAATCSAFVDRYTEIKTWDCKSDIGKRNHPNLAKLCKAPSPGPVTGGPPAVVSTPSVVSNPQPGATSGAQTPPAMGVVSCDKLPFGMTMNQNDCSNMGATAANGSCVGADGKASSKTPYVCMCGDKKLGDVQEAGRCPGSKPSGSGSGTGGKVKKEKEGTNWLLVGGIGIGLMYLMHWLTKRALSEQYGQINPGTQTPDITVPPLPTTMAPPQPIPFAPKSAQ